VGGGGVGVGVGGVGGLGGWDVVLPVTVNETVFDCAPLSMTVTGTTAAAATSLAMSCAFSVEELTKVVGSPVPFRATCDVDENPAPLTTSVKLLEPAAVARGVMEVIAATALDAVALMVKVTAAETVLPVCTVMLAVPPAATSAAVIAACSVEPFKYAVARCPPFHITTEVFSKFAPFTMRVKALSPAVADIGEILDIAGPAAYANVPSMRMKRSTKLRFTCI